MIDGEKLPNCEKAHVADAKLYSYLLNREHPDGKSKARFYEHIGYVPDQAEQLRSDLIRLACSGNVTSVKPNAQGRKYTVVGPISAPNGRTPPAQCVGYRAT